MKFSLSKCIFSVLFLFFLTGLVFPEVTPSASGLIRFSSRQVPRYLKAPVDMMRDKANLSKIRQWAAARGEGGVLFIATAEPENENINKMPISISYNKNAKDGSRLQIKIGSQEIIYENLYDWMLLPIAGYIDSGYINALTLLGKPDPYNENDDFENFRMIPDQILEKNLGVFWAEYNPALVNTLVGFNMYLVDALLINENYRDSNIRRITDHLGIINGYNENEKNLDYKKNIIKTSTENAKKIKIKMNKYLESDDFPYSTYIFSDSDEGVSFNIVNGKIIFKGTPHYHFLSEFSFLGESTYFDEPSITNNLNEDPELVCGLNPAVFDTMKNISHLAAFFRYVKYRYETENNSEAWNIFIKQTGIINPDHKPVKGLYKKDNVEQDKEGFKKYNYVFDDKKYYQSTPRSLDFLGSEMEEAYKLFLDSISFNDSQILTNKKESIETILFNKVKYFLDKNNLIGYYRNINSNKEKFLFLIVINLFINDEKRLDDFDECIYCILHIH